MTLLGMDYYHTPRVCEECGGVMIFKGVGEYHCEDCGAVAYDDYGKVRLYIEEHKGATASEIEASTGVPQRSIRQMLRESRIEVAESSKMFLHCELCGKDIRSGRYCRECEEKYHRNIEEEKRQELRKLAQGFGAEKKTAEEGEKRFIRRES